MKRPLLAVLVILVGLAPVRAQTADERQATVAYLQKLQQPDGGFLAAAPQPGAAPGKSTLQATVAAVRALHYFGGEPRDRAAAAQYVEDSFDPATGGFRNVPGGKPDVPVTAIGLMGVAALKLPADRYADPAVRFLGERARRFEDVRMAAAGLEAAGKASPQAAAWMKQFAEMRNPDGTYGQGKGTARQTGSVVVTVLRLGGKVDDRDRVLKALRAGQRKDGGWGTMDATDSDLATTYRVMRCFHMLHEKPDAAACRAFVARCRNPDGGYGVTPGQSSAVSGTYFAGSVLHWLDEK
jgi:prenyltransferase beta subunit